MENPGRNKKMADLHKDGKMDQSCLKKVTHKKLDTK